MRPVGAHVPVGGGLLRAIERAAERGCDALQVFPCNPRAWALPDPDPAGDEAAREELERRGWPLFLHAPYLVNLASPDRTVWERSAVTLEFSLQRAARLDATVVVHAGHCVGAKRPDALERVRAAVTTLLDRVGDARLALELTAGGAGAVAAVPGEMAELLDALDHDPRVTCCLDTCHLWAAGVDYSRPSVLRDVRAQLAALGPGRISVVHLNDSKDPCGSRRDRHARLGQGSIGTDTLRALVAAPEFDGAPLVVETPGGADAHRDDVATARTFVSRPRRRSRGGR